MADADKIYTAKLYLADKYAGNPNGLRKLADEVATCAFDNVTITGQSFEGASHQGQLGFDKMDYLRAVMEVIAAIDPNYVPPASSATSAYYRFRAPFGLGGTTDRTC